MIAWVPNAWASIVSTIGPLTDVKIGVVAAIIAIFAITWPLRYQRSAALLDQAVHALERAYNALTDSGANTDPVAPVQLNWLTAARNIETYKVLKKQIRVRVHRIIAEDHEEHWWHRFYLALQGSAYNQPSYYKDVAAGPREQRRSGIEPQSAVIVHAFAKWPEGRRDPVEHADYDRIFEETDPRPGNIGLSYFLNDATSKGTARFRNLPQPYPNRSRWARCLQTLRLRKRL